MRCLFCLSLFIFLILIVLSVQGEPHFDYKKMPVQLGFIDISNRNLEKEGIIKLTGQWEFYWKHLLYPSDFASEIPPTKTGYLTLPGNWNEQMINGQTFDSYGYATFRLKIRASSHPAFYAIKLLDIRSSYIIFINQKRVGSRGIVGQTEQTTQPKMLGQIIDFKHSGGDIDIILQVANFYFSKGGFSFPILFGMQEQITHIREKNLVIEFFLFGCIFIFAFNHLVIFLLNREDKTSLFFALACFIVAFRSIIMGERFFSSLFPGIGYDWLLSLEYLTAYLIPPVFIAFFHFLYPREFSKRFTLGTVAIFLMLVAVVLAYPAQIFSETLFIFEILCLALIAVILYFFYLAVRNKRDGINIVLTGFFFVILASVNDILFSSGFIQTGFYLPKGLLVFICFHSFLLAHRSNKAYIKIETLSKELHQINENLEKNIAERTIDLKEANRKLQHEIDVREKTTRELEKARHEAETANKAKSEFLANMSHELRTPMHGILGFADFGVKRIDKVEPSRLLDFFEEIRSSGKRLLALLNDLLDLAKLESGRTKYDFGLIHLSEVVNISIKEFYPVVAQKNITLVFSEPELEDKVTIDKDKILQVIRNLLSNAIKFSEENSEIKISIEDQTELIRLSVKDSGVGIPENELDDVFDKFIQSSKTQKGTSGTGLGLPISRQIIIDHQGTIMAENNPDKGTTLSFTLPKRFKEKKQPNDAQIEVSDSSDESKTIGFNKPKQNTPRQKGRHQ